MMHKLNSVLLIDDDNINNTINKMLFKKLAISDNIIVAPNGKVALDLISENCANNEDCPNLIFLDINMPVMNGFEFLNAFEKKEIKNKSSVIIIMLTTSENPKDLENSMHPHVAGFLNKPLTNQKVNDVILKHFN